jgi:uncharacterized membrane protein YdjX (TVP38/TMEM64 family)
MTTSKKTNTSDASEGFNSKWKWIAAGAAVLVLMVAWQLLPLQDWLTALEARIERMGVFGGVLYAAVYIAGALVFVPGSILGLGAGYLFGIAGGLAVGWVGVTVSAAIAFLIARYLARHPVERLARRNPKFGAIDAAVRKSGWKVVALFRLCAVMPFALSNYLFGLSSVPFVPYLVASSIGMIPGILFYVYLGAAGKSLLENGARGPWDWALLAAGLVTSAIMAVVLTRVAKKQLKGGGRREGGSGAAWILSSGAGNTGIRD